ITRHCVVEITQHVRCVSQFFYNKQFYAILKIKSSINMNETEKEFVRYLKLDHGLQYKDGTFIHTKPLIDEGRLKIEEYTKVHIYEPTGEKQTSAWDIISKRFQTSECENSEHTSGHLPQEYLKLIIPILKITYVGNPLNSFKSYAKKSDKTELCQQFLAETVLVGGGLIIKNSN
ncbi:4039_t:CDS:1, partial [Racocetra fulgida]